SIPKEKLKKERPQFPEPQVVTPTPVPEPESQKKTAVLGIDILQKRIQRTGSTQILKSLVSILEHGKLEKNDEIPETGPSRSASILQNDAKGQASLAEQVENYKLLKELGIIEETEEKIGSCKMFGLITELGKIFNHSLEGDLHFGERH
ncbi:15194_t:CDS:2, partial [Gigaspora rosea]